MRESAKSHFRRRVFLEFGSSKSMCDKSPRVGVTTLNWAPNGQPFGSNAGTASNNKATISTAHSLSDRIIMSGLLWETRLPVFLQHRARQRQTNILVIINNNCLIRRWEVGQTSLMKMLKRAHTYTLGPRLFGGGSHLRSRRRRVGGFQRSSLASVCCNPLPPLQSLSLPPRTTDWRTEQRLRHSHPADKVSKCVKAFQ